MNSAGWRALLLGLCAIVAPLSLIDVAGLRAGDSIDIRPSPPVERFSGSRCLPATAGAAERT